jgi:hypothetical protein
MSRSRKELEPARKPVRKEITQYCHDNPGLSRRQVYRLAAQGKLRLVKFGGQGKAYVEEIEGVTLEPVVPGERSKAVQAMLDARKAKSRVETARSETDDSPNPTEAA